MSFKVRELRELQDKLLWTEEKRARGVHVVITENGHKIVSASGEDGREASVWLLRAKQRLGRQIEAIVLKAGYMSAEDIDRAIEQDEDWAADHSEE